MKKALRGQRYAQGCVRDYSDVVLPEVSEVTSPDVVGEIRRRMDREVARIEATDMHQILNSEFRMLISTDPS